MTVAQASHNNLLGSPGRSYVCSNFYSFLLFLVKVCSTGLGDGSFGVPGGSLPHFSPPKKGVSWLSSQGWEQTQALA